jgi:hypothetical protein
MTFIIGTGSVRSDAAEVAVQRQAGRFGRGARDGQRDAEDRVRAEVGLVLGAVDLLHHQIMVDHAFDFPARARPHARRGNGSCRLAAMRCSTLLDGLEHALAAVALLVAVAQLERFARAGGCAGRHRGAAELTPAGVRATHVDFDVVGLPRESRISRWRDAASTLNPLIPGDVLGAPDGTVGVRIPDSNIEKQIVTACNKPLITPAVRTRDKVPVTDYQQAREIVEEGLARNGEPFALATVEARNPFRETHSTVVRVHGKTFDGLYKIERPGAISAARLDEALRGLAGARR